MAESDNNELTTDTKVAAALPMGSPFSSPLAYSWFFWLRLSGPGLHTQSHHIVHCTIYDTVDLIPNLSCNVNLT